MELITAPFKRIFQKAGIEKIDQEALEVWVTFIEDLTFNIGRKLSNNKKVKKEDIEKIIKELNKTINELIK